MPTDTEALAAPGDILDFWIGPASEDAAVADAKMGLWFRKSFETDREIAQRFLPTMAVLPGRMAEEWAARGPRERLAAIIALDQFPRNVFRNTPGAFQCDGQALSLALAGIEVGEDRTLTEVERLFFYLPLEHAENAGIQARCVALFEALAAEARAEFKPMIEGTLDFARKHKAVIDRFGRFPHRNGVLDRESTPEEAEYLSQPGAGF